MNSVIKVNQALHGYANGHQLIASSVDLSADDKRLMDELSDLSGICVENHFVDYYTGYPVDGGRKYVLAKTWYAHEKLRPGCVWTHSLILNIEDVGRILCMKSFEKLFTRPNGKNYDVYGTEIEYQNMGEDAFTQYDRKKIQYWSGLPDYVFNKDCMIQNWLDANMLKGGIAYSNKVTTVSNTYAWEIQTEEYGEGLAEHLRYHNNKILGIVNGIDTDIWNPATDKLLAADYDEKSAIKNKKINKKALQESLGLDVDEHKMVIGLISRLTNQKGLDLVNDVIPGIMDEHTQVVVLGTGDSQYENTFRYYENKYKGNFCAYIAYNENVAHNIYAGCDALLVPSRFEPCGLTQLIAMRYGAVPIVRETGGLKDTVQPYNMFENTGNGFTFDRYESGLLYDAINRAKTLYFENRKSWDDMVIRDMNKDVSWEKSAKQYKDMYVGLTPRD